MNNAIKKVNQCLVLSLKTLLFHVRSISEYKAVLRNPLIVKLVMADSISALGNRFTYFALLKKVYEISGGNVIDLGFLVTAQVLPFVLFGAFAGALVDRVSRRRVMIISDLCNGIAIIGLLFVTNLSAIYVVSFIATCFYTFRMPAQNAFEPNLVVQKDIPLLNSFKSFTSSFIGVAGYSLGAVIVAFWGTTTSFLIDATTFFVSAVIIIGIRQQEGHIERVRERVKIPKATHCMRIFYQFKADVKAGVALIRDNISLKLLLVLETSLSFMFGMQGMLIYLFVRETLKMGEKAELAWGGIMSSLFMGSIVGSLFMGLLIKRYSNQFKLFLWVLLFDGIVLIFFTLNTVFVFSILISFLLGIIGAAPAVTLTTILQKSVVDENRGKVFSLFDMLTRPMTLFSVFFGTMVTKLISAQGTLFVLALFEIVIVLVIFSSETYRFLNREAEQLPLYQPADATIAVHAESGS